MDTTSYIALSRQVALQRHMATIANNIANAATTGYRAERTLFEPVLEPAGEPRRLAFVQDVGLYRDLSPGPITQTGNRLDLAIDGEGYFAFRTGAGVRYGRAGHLELDAEGRLVDARGNPILDDGGAPVTVPQADRDLTIGADGTVANRAGPIARLQPVTFANEQALRREGDGLYRAAADQQPRPAAGRVAQGALEQANVSPVQEMTTMVETYEPSRGRSASSRPGTSSTAAPSRGWSRSTPEPEAARPARN
jgi:flagellar basal-body rod protein FlgF